jgi:hypothetical protein
MNRKTKEKMMAKRKVQEDVEVKQEENVVDEGTVVEDESKVDEHEDPKTTMSIDDMVAQLKNDLVFSSVSTSPVTPKVDELPKSTPHRRKANDIVDLGGNPVKINGRSNSSSIVIGRGM